MPDTLLGAVAENHEKPAQRWEVLTVTQQETCFLPGWSCVNSEPLSYSGNTYGAVAVNKYPQNHPSGKSAIFHVSDKVHLLS